MDVENKAFDTNHAVLSNYIAKSWKLNNRLCRIISQHHNLDIFRSDNVKDSQEDVLLGVLKIAEHIAGLHRILGNQQQDFEWEEIGKNVLVTVGLTKYEMDDLEATAADAGFGQQLYFR